MNTIPLADRDFLIEEFKRLAGFDSESFNEKRISEYLIERLKELGLKVATDNAEEELLREDYNRTDTASNIYAYLKGNIKGTPKLFCAHMDTVSPGRGKQVIQKKDRLVSAKDTVLGADDISGIISILWSLNEIKAKDFKHPDIEVLFTVAEEPYCSGSRFIDYSMLQSKTGYVFDLSGEAGRIAVAAPSIISIDVTVEGKASHAGFAPEKGINALNAAANALAEIKTGRTEEELTVNFGLIRGGEGKNIVPESIYIGGEIRSSDHEKALIEAEKAGKVFKTIADELGAKAEFKVTEHIRAYRLGLNSPTVSRFYRALLKTGYCEKIGYSPIPGDAALEKICVDTFGGSDANRLNENGIETAVVACGMENCHTTEEFARISDIERSARIALAMMLDQE